MHRSYTAVRAGLVLGLTVLTAGCAATTEMAAPPGPATATATATATPSGQPSSDPPPATTAAPTVNDLGLQCARRSVRTEFVQAKTGKPVLLRVTGVKVSSSKRDVIFDRTPPPPLKPGYVPAGFALLAEDVGPLLKSRAPEVSHTVLPDLSEPWLPDTAHPGRYVSYAYAAPVRVTLTARCPGTPTKTFHLQGWRTPAFGLLDCAVAPHADTGAALARRHCRELT